MEGKMIYNVVIWDKKRTRGWCDLSTEQVIWTCL